MRNLESKKAVSHFLSRRASFCLSLFSALILFHSAGVYADEGTSPFDGLDAKIGELRTEILQVQLDGYLRSPVLRKYRRKVRIKKQPGDIEDIAKHFETALLKPIAPLLPQGTVNKTLAKNDLAVSRTPQGNMATAAIDKTSDKPMVLSVSDALTVKKAEPIVVAIKDQQKPQAAIAQAAEARPTETPQKPEEAKPAAEELVDAPVFFEGFDTQQTVIADARSTVFSGDILKAIRASGENRGPYTEFDSTEIKPQAFNGDFTHWTDRSWRISLASGHWPTLFWWDKTEKYSRKTQLFAQNTLAYLALQGGVSLDSESGLVFGKARRGWRVELSDPSIKPLYFGMDFKPIMESEAFSRPQTDLPADQKEFKYYYFIFLNVEPGTMSVAVNPTTPTGVGGSVSVPVVAQTSTFLNLTKLKRRTVSGWVTKQVKRSNVAIANAEVKIIGLSSDNTRLTDNDGAFKFDFVPTISSYPLSIETNAGDGDSSGFTHRYSIDPDNTVQLNLHRISDKKFGIITQRMPQAVHEKLGQVVGDFQGLINANPDALLMPELATFTLPTTGNTPGIYTLGPAEAKKSKINEPLELRPLQPVDNRVFGVNIPEGPFVVDVRGEDGSIVKSILGHSSENVINILQ